MRKIFDFVLFGSAFVLFSAFIRPQKNRRRKIVGFAAGRFGGNVKYLCLEMARRSDLKVFFVSDQKGMKGMSGKGVDAHYYLDVKSVGLFLRTHAWVTSHGPYYIPFVGFVRGFLPFFKWKHGSKWIDVWHGLGFVHVERGKILENYDLAFTTSEFFRKHYSEGDSDIAEKIKITGYPRNDPLIDERWSREEIEKELGIPTKHKNILYAPTWGHKYKKKLFPWMDMDKFLEKIEDFCEKNDCNFLIRMHPMWSMRNVEQRRFLEVRSKQLKRIFHVLPREYADTQRLLYISDVLITDWSSIANDFIVLNRPMIFLQTQFPVKRFVLKPEDRAGYIVKGDEFFAKLDESVTKPNLSEEQRRQVLKKLYKYVDGNSSKRCIDEIVKLLETS